MVYPQIIAFEKPVKPDIERTAHRLTDKNTKIDAVLEFYVRERMKETGESYAVVLSDVLRRHENLARNYRKMHTYEAM